MSRWGASSSRRAGLVADQAQLAQDHRQVALGVGDAGLFQEQLAHLNAGEVGLRQGVEVLDESHPLGRRQGWLASGADGRLVEKGFFFEWFYSASQV